MSRGFYISMLLIAVVAWALSASLNIWRVLQHGLSINDMLIDSSIVFPALLVPIWLAELIKFATAEREKNVLDPHFVVHAGEPAIVRPLRGLLCVSFVAFGGLGLRGQGPFAILHSAPLLIAIVVFGALGATMVFTPRARLKLSSEGLDYSQMRPSHVPWHEVVDVKRRSILLNSRIVLTLKNTTEFRSANPLARWRRVERVVLMPFTFGLDPKALAQGIEARRNVFTF
jgi:hypothetical protein